MSLIDSELQIPQNIDQKSESTVYANVENILYGADEQYGSFQAVSSRDNAVPASVDYGRVDVGNQINSEYLNMTESQAQSPRILSEPDGEYGYLLILY